MKFGVARSSIPDGGCGLFSFQNIKAGTMIGIYKGEYVD